MTTDPHRYLSVTEMLFSTDVAQGPGTFSYAGKHKYEELPAQAEDWHVQTSGGVKKRVLPNQNGHYSFAAFGPKYNTTEDNSELLSKAAKAANNSELKLTGHFALLKPVKIENPVRIIGEDCAIFDPNDLTNVIHFTHENSSIRNITFIGYETLSKFQSNLPRNAADIRAFIRFSSVQNVKISHIIGSGKRALVVLDDCYNSNISDCYMEGFLPVITAGELGQAEANKCAAVCVFGGAKNNVSRIYALNHGSVVLSGLDTVGIRISQISGRSLHDNGVYCSSGTDGVVQNCTGISDVIGTGVKSRGSRNIIRDCYVKRCGVGFVMTGNGLTPDKYGANGVGNQLLNCTTEDDYSYPWQATKQDGFFQRNLTIKGMLSLNGSRRGGKYSATIGFVSGLIYSNNTMLGHKGEQYAFILSGAKNTKLSSVHLLDNHFYNGNGMAMRIQYVDEGQISKNLGNGNLSQLIELRNVNNLVVSDNQCLDQDVVKWSSNYPGRDCVIQRNIGNLNIGKTLAFHNEID